MTSPHPQRMLRFVLAVMASLLLLAPPRQAKAQETEGLAAALAVEKAFIKAIQDAEASVVSIARYRPAPAGRFENPHPLEFELRKKELRRDTQQPASQDFVPNDFGTGVIFAPSWNPEERVILTNYHVVRGGPTVVPEEKPPTEKPDDTRLYVRFSDRRGYEAKILAADPRSDLAVLKIDFDALGTKPADLRPIPVPAQPDIRKGQIALSLGNPYAIGRDGSASASWGMVSNISRRPAPQGSFLDEDARRRETIHTFGTLIHLDTRLNVGTSGSPVLNLRGELIGLATSLAAIEGYEKSAGYAIPVDGSTRRILDDLAHGYEVEYGFLGIEPTDVDAEEMRIQFPQVKAVGAAMALVVFPDAPAGLAGLQPRDVVLAVNGTPVYGRYDLMRIVGLLGPDATASLRVYRERQTRDKAGRELQINVNLGKWPVIDDDGIIASHSRFPDFRGIAVDYCTGRQKYLPQSLRSLKGVVVTKVPPKTGAAVSDLQPGDLITRVNGTPVSSPATFHKTVSGLDGDVTLDLTDGRKVVVRK